MRLCAGQGNEQSKRLLPISPPFNRPAATGIFFLHPAKHSVMKEDRRWKLIAGIGLVILSLAMYTAHYLIFQDEHHLFIFFIGDLAFIPIEILIVTLIIDQLLEAREKKARMEKLNMVIGTFFSTLGTPLLAMVSSADPGIGTVRSNLIIGADWGAGRFHDVQVCLDSHACAIAGDRIDREALRSFLLGREEFIIRLVENPMVFEHESFTGLILAINHLTEELKARQDLSALPPADINHLSSDIQRVYALLVPEWLKYMEYLKNQYPYLFSLAMRTNPFDESASVVVRG
jgi:hypothetical protein